MYDVRMVRDTFHMLSSTISGLLSLLLLSPFTVAEIGQVVRMRVGYRHRR